jgi:hypothetical protein
MKCVHCKENNADQKSNDRGLCLDCYNFIEEEDEE